MAKATAGWCAGLCLVTGCMDHVIVTGHTPEDDTSTDMVLSAGLTTYRVTGGDPQAIALSANAAAGGADGRQRFIGFHRWNIEWKVDAARAATRWCSIPASRATPRPCWRTGTPGGGAPSGPSGLNRV